MNFERRLHFQETRATSHMGRRKVGVYPIRQIKIVIGDHVERFDLELETLLGRRQCVRRAHALHDEAISHIQRLNSDQEAHRTNTIFSAPPQIAPAPERPPIEGNVERYLNPATTGTEYDVWNADFGPDCTLEAREDSPGFSWPFQS
jgi:hypothetical protein